ncbi:MAG TPA: zf-HC2 domain-containing protein, partial [Polyangia bacterium]|nr:zf-HC2 domain-containing protein [Polyangia bacterium]
MSEATQQTTAACEQLLDYVYDMLDAPQKAAFEQHLATCARCQAEAASFGKVRAASAKLMPDVEPTANLTGALHAQLMHAASQRKASRGKLLAFPRRIMQHPAWAAAAMFVIVGSAITINVMRDKFAMPTTTQAESAPAPASVSVAQPEMRPLPEPVAAAAKRDQLDGVADPNGKTAVGGKGAEMKMSRPHHASASLKMAKAEDEASGALGGLGSAASSGGGGAGLAAKPAAHAAKKAAPAREAADDVLADADKAASPRAKDARDTSATTGVARLSKEEERSLNEAPPAPRQQTQTKVASELMRNAPSGGRTYDEPT